MYTIEYYRNKIEKIPFQKFCTRLLENPQDPDTKCILGFLGVEDCAFNKWYNISQIPEAKELNYLFVKYLYPLLKAKGFHFNDILLEQGKILYGINDNEIKICITLGITHRTVKGRLLQAITKIEKIIESEKLLKDAIDNTEEADFKVID